MRKLYARRLISAHTTTSIKDQNRRVHYLISGHWGKKGDIIFLNSIFGENILKIRQTKFHPIPRFEIFKKNKLIATLSRPYGIGYEFLLVKKVNWLILGNSLNLQYKFYHRNKLLATLNCISISGGEVWEISVFDSKNEPLALCLLAVIDFFGKATSKKDRKKRLNVEFISKKNTAM